METGTKRVVVGGRLNDESEGELKLVFEDGILQKGRDHRHSCGGKVTLITMPKEVKNAGAILVCDTCLWRFSFDPKLLVPIRNEELLCKIFAECRGRGISGITYYCIDCMNVPTSGKCQTCHTKETDHADHQDDSKK